MFFPSARSADTAETIGNFMGSGNMFRAFFEGGLMDTNQYSQLKEPTLVDDIPVQIPPSANDVSYRPVRYSRLEEREIRVLELLPPSPDESVFRQNLRCRLITVKLDSDFKYEALSWTWGKMRRSVPIVIAPEDGNRGERKGQTTGTGNAAHTSTVRNGRSILGWPLQKDLMEFDHAMSSSRTPKIMSNEEAIFVAPPLLSALQRLVWKDKPRYLWIDQMCINQDDYAERDSQMLLMKDIYKGAMTTTIWIGDAIDKDCIIFVEEMVDVIHDSNDGVRSDSEALAKLFEMSDEKGQIVPEIYKLALEKLLNRQWFTRAWVFQEAVLGHAPEVQCGQYRLAFDALRRVLFAVSELEQRAGGYKKSLETQTRGYKMLKAIDASRADWNRGQETGDFLTLLVRILHQVSATNPRDLIYGFLAFYVPTNPVNAIVPNSALTVAQVWRDSTFKIISNSSSLDIFALAPGNVEFKDVPHPDYRPSWVPDFQNAFQFSRPFCAPDMKSAFLADGDALFSARIENDGCTLVIRGKIIDSIAYTCPLSYENKYYYESVNQNIQLDNHVAWLEKRLAPPIKEDLRNIAIRTILADGANSDAQPLTMPAEHYLELSNQEEHLRQLRDKLDGGVDIGESDARKVQQYKDFCELTLISQRKRLFVTRKRRIGMASGANRFDDAIAIVKGSKTPIIIRKITDDEVKTKSGRLIQFWKLVGQCYLHEAMFGEVVEGTDWWDDAEDLHIL